jgi:hypothetical protein
MLVRLYKLHWSDKDGIIASFAILADDDVFAGHALPLFFPLDDSHFGNCGMLLC